MSLAGHVRKRWGTRLYKPMLSEQPKYAKNAAEEYRKQGYSVRVVRDDKRPGQVLVWRSVNPKRLKGKRTPKLVRSVI